MILIKSMVSRCKRSLYVAFLFLLDGSLQSGAQKSKIVFKPNPYCLPKCVILKNISDATKCHEVQFKLGGRHFYCHLTYHCHFCHHPGKNWPILDQFSHQPGHFWSSLSLNRGGNTEKHYYRLIFLTGPPKIPL